MLDSHHLSIDSNDRTIQIGRPAEGDRRSSEGRVDVGIIQLSNDDKKDDDKEDDDKEDDDKEDDDKED